MGKLVLMVATLCVFSPFISIVHTNARKTQLTIEDLLSQNFSHKTSHDIDSDPCKADYLFEDIAISDADEIISFKYRNLLNTSEAEGYFGSTQNISSEIYADNLAFQQTHVEENYRNDDIRRKHRSVTEKKKKKFRSKRRRRAATGREDRIWDNGVIPYEIDANFTGSDKGLFKQAMRHWENFTCIKFVEKDETHENYITFTTRECGCCSFVGKRGNGPQAISIGKNCDKFGIVVHELGHVVGFWHEHTRPDRDNHVVIIRDNIQQGQDYNFNKLTSGEVNSLGQKYDFSSIMHYAKATFAKATYLDTILPRPQPGQDSLPEIGQRVKLSEGDIKQTQLLYNCPKCGRTFQLDSATFGYKDQDSLEPGEYCEWRITATHGERIVLNVTTLRTVKSNSCQISYLQVWDGYWYESPLLGTLCGTLDSPQQFISTGPRMIIKYMPSQEKEYGFEASYEAICGGSLNTEEGRLESPNYPDDYKPNKECVWTITVPKGYQVALIFNSFQIENHDACVYDFLEIRGGLLATSPLIGVYCGFKIPDGIKSETNEMRISFVSDGSVQKEGFSATFLKEFDECAGDDHGCEHICVNKLGGFECQCRIGFELHSNGKNCEDACGGRIEASNGTITSPSFPDLYPVNKNCIWVIVAPPKYRITLNFTHFDLEGNNQDCEYDKVEIGSVMSEAEIRRHGIYCGHRLPSPVTSEGNSLRIQFSSDNSVQKSGFAAIFFTDKDECKTDNGGCQHICKNTMGSYACSCHNGFTLHSNLHDCKEGGCKHEITAPIGEVFSPNYPDYYPSRKGCIWQLTTTPGHRIRLTFDEFEMEPHQECTYDHVLIYDGEAPDAPILGRYCGAKLPHPIIASSNKMGMVFKSDSSVQRKGFRAKHSTVCGGHLQANEHIKHLYSHAKYGDQNYENKEDCDWVIEAPLGSKVHFSFMTFELEEESDCGYDYVQIYLGYDDTSKSFGKFCGSMIPREVVSESQAILIKFRTDDTINSKGFSAAFAAVNDEKSMDTDSKEPFSFSFSRGY